MPKSLIDLNDTDINLDDIVGASNANQPVQQDSFFQPTIQISQPQIIKEIVIAIVEAPDD
jgi:hypothetical protein